MSCLLSPSRAPIRSWLRASPRSYCNSSLSLRPPSSLLRYEQPCLRSLSLTPVVPQPDPLPKKTVEVSTPESEEPKDGPAQPKPAKSLFEVYRMLSKARLSYFVVFTSHAGYCVVNDPSQFVYSQFFLGLTLGTFLQSAAANTFNQIIEVEYDSQMSRTMNRPLPRKTITQNHALAFALGSATTGTALLYNFCGLPATILGTFNIALYAGLYTWMKRRHWLNTQVGAVVGAIPPLMGSSCNIGWDCLVHPGALSLSAILFFWQIPHFYAIAYNRRADYTRAGYRMLVHENERSAQNWALGSALALWPVCFYSYSSGYTDHLFLVASTLANIIYTGATIPFWRQLKNKESQRLFKVSLVYILMIVAGMFCDIIYKRYDYHQKDKCPVHRLKEKKRQREQDQGVDTTT